MTMADQHVSSSNSFNTVLFRSSTRKKNEGMAKRLDDASSKPLEAPFLPLEETSTGSTSNSTQAGPSNSSSATESTSSAPAKCSLKKFISFSMFAIIAFVIWDAVFTSPEHRLIQPDFSQKFLVWVQSNPLQGLLAFLFVIAFAVVFMIPIGTPLTLGCGYIYKGAYGWKLGLTVATIVSMAGSALGAVVCFLLGRYLMRDQVRQWIKKYPLFVAIDIASAEHGLKIMAMLYLTPVLPLGPVSYMCGTTSMLLSHFVLAKVASLPLMLLYCFIGASTGALLTNSSDNDSVKSIENNESLIISGIGMSFVMIALITRQVKKELNKILERQKKGGKGPEDEDVEDPNQASALELSNRGNLARHRKREP